MQIWKYEVEMVDNFTIEMPVGARILSVQTQTDREYPRIWVLVNPTIDVLATRHFKLVGTGHNFDPDGYTFVGTFQIQRTGLVFHLFVWGPSL